MVLAFWYMCSHPPAWEYATQPFRPLFLGSEPHQTAAFNMRFPVSCLNDFKGSALSAAAWKKVSFFVRIFMCWHQYRLKEHFRLETDCSQLTKPLHLIAFYHVPQPKQGPQCSIHRKHRLSTFTSDFLPTCVSSYVCLLTAFLEEKGIKSLFILSRWSIVLIAFIASGLNSPRQN